MIVETTSGHIGHDGGWSCHGDIMISDPGAVTIQPNANRDMTTAQADAANMEMRGWGSR